MPTKRATTIRYQRWLWNKRINPRLGTHDLAALDRATIRYALKEIGVSGHTTANRAQGLLRHMLNVAVENELLASSPMARMASLFKESSRDRVLKEHEIEAFWAALSPERRCEWRVSARMCAALQLVLVTGARGNEIAGLCAEEIDISARLWTIPASRFKGKRAQTIPLTSMAMGILEQAFGGPAHEWSGFAFPNALHENQPMERMSLTRAMHVIVDGIGIERATPHDLRRTMATYMASEKVGVAPHVITAVLGHSPEGAVVTRIYNRHLYDREKRAALEAWSRLLAEIVQPAGADDAGSTEIKASVA